MAEGGRQVFSALELGPGCLVLGINDGPPLAEGPLGASDWRDTRWTALEKITMWTFSRGLAVITRSSRAMLASLSWQEKIWSRCKVVEEFSVSILAGKDQVQV